MGLKSEAKKRDEVTIDHGSNPTCVSHQMANTVMPLRIQPHSQIISSPSMFRMVSLKIKHLGPYIYKIYNALNNKWKLKHFCIRKAQGQELHHFPFGCFLRDSS